MDMKPARRMTFVDLNAANITNISVRSIIQDCEDALTNWVTSNAAVKPKLSTRARTLSQRRHQNQNRVHRQPGEGVDLASQDQPMKGHESGHEGSHEGGLWVPANAHREHGIGGFGDQEDEQEEEYVEDHHQGQSSLNGETRGREEERAVEA